MTTWDLGNGNAALFAENKRVKTFSLHCKPKILMLDESTSALPNDMKLKVELELKRSGVTIIMISHDQEQINRLGTMRLSLAAVDE